MYGCNIRELLYKRILKQQYNSLGDSIYLSESHVVLKILTGNWFGGNLEVSSIWWILVWDIEGAIQSKNVKLNEWAFSSMVIWFIVGWKKGSFQWQIKFLTQSELVNLQIWKSILKYEIRGKHIQIYLFYLLALAVLNVSVTEVFELKQVLINIYWFKYRPCMSTDQS